MIKCSWNVVKSDNSQMCGTEKDKISSCVVGMTFVYMITRPCKKWCSKFGIHELGYEEPLICGPIGFKQNVVVNS
jgi:hypothetical protein